MMDDRIMLATNGKGKKIWIDRCSFCIHFDRLHQNIDCRNADFDSSIDECRSYTRLSSEDIENRIGQLFEE